MVTTKGKRIHNSNTDLCRDRCGCERIEEFDGNIPAPVELTDDQIACLGGHCSWFNYDCCRSWFGPWRGIIPRLFGRFAFIVQIALVAKSTELYIFIRDMSARTRRQHLQSLGDQAFEVVLEWGDWIWDELRDWWNS